MSGIRKIVRCLSLAGLSLLILTGVAPLATAQNYQAGLKAVDDGDVARAVEIWQDMVDRDSPDRARAEYALALLYETGRAVPWDEARAAELYQASGLPEALTNLGLMYAEGRGVPYDPAKAAELWTQASDQGHSFAKFNLGLAFYGGDGVPKNAVRALELIYEAGEGGLAEAQWAVCQFYERGVGVPVDLDKAIEWCALAAAQGQLQAVDAVQRMSAQQRTQAADPVELEALPNADSDNVDLSGEAATASGFASGDGEDPADEFVTQMPGEGSQTATATAEPDQSETADRASSETPEPVDPLILLGSEFEEFADLLAPLEETPPAGQDGSTVELRDLSQLSEDSDEIAALIESAGPLSPSLPDLDISEQPEPSEVRVEIEEGRGTQLSLQELVDGQSADTAQPTALPPLPTNRPHLRYAIPPIIDEPVYAVWMGSGENTDEAAALHDQLMQTAPDILGIMQAAYQDDVLTKEMTGASKDMPIVRLLFGPLPGQEYAWQICNLLRLKEQSMFCYPVALED